MQIKNIVLYKDNEFEPRVIPFTIGKLNIITGESKTGKTAIIDIIDYCLGSDNCNIKGRVIRENVEWYAITIQFKNDQVFIARKNPYFLGAKTTSEIYFSLGKEIGIPEYNILTNNSNLVALKKFLSNKLGMSENLFIPEKNTRDSLESTFKHSRIFCFQPQNVIAEFKYLFFNQDDGFVTQAIKDTLPYILGAVHEDELIIQQKISVKKRELNKLLRDLKLEQSIKSQSLDKIYSLIDEAKEVNLIQKDITFENDEQAIEGLSKLLNHDLITKEPLGENNQLNELIEKRKELNQEINNIEEEIQAVVSFSDDNSNYKTEVNEQINRLMTIGLYKEPESRNHWNAIIGEESDFLPPSLDIINNSLIELQNNLNYVEQERPKVQKFLVDLRNKHSEIKSEINKLSKSIENIYKQNKEIEYLKNDNIIKGRIIGRISLLLESLSNVESISPLNLRIQQLEFEITELESQISAEEKENKLNAILNKINILMTSWRDKVDWEYKKSNLRFDSKKLTLYAETDEKSDSLQEMGSAENWLACHILIHLALHHHFITKKRPVPNFVIFDQPTQVHYPKNYQELPGKAMKSSDEIADEKLFNFLYEISDNFSQKLQIIVMDHANFSSRKFQSSIIEEWRNNIKLIPVEWLK